MALVELLWEKDWEDMEVAVGPEGREPLPFNMCCVERVELLTLCFHFWTSGGNDLVLDIMHGIACPPTLAATP